MAKGRIFQKDVAVTVDTDLYTAGDALGTKQSLEIPSPHAGVIRAIRIVDNDDQDVNINVWLFDSEPTGVADDAALSLADADAAKLIDVVLVDTRVDGTNNRIGVEKPNNYFRITDGNKLWFQMATAGGPTYAGGVLTVRFTIEY